MNTKVFHKLAVLILFLLCASVASGAAAPSQPPKYFFTDEISEMPFSGADGEIAYELKTITRGGWGPAESGTVQVRDGKIAVKPLAEGIHILTLKAEKPVELRFLAIAPPPAVDADALRKNLPRSSGKLLNKEPFKILAMGDSVTNTGDYESMLAMMLSRSTGNKEIIVVDRSYPGRSIDASIRNFQSDAVLFKPDLTLIMYGLNDQAAGCPLDGFLEQYEWLAAHLATECGSDSVFLQPTPHIDIPVRKDDERPNPNPTEYAFRTIGFAEPLKQLAGKLKIPCAETFNALWNDNGKTIVESVEKMWPLYPPSYSKQFISMIETDGKGDTIHPNALGHLMIAKAVYEAIARPKAPELLEMKGDSKWTDSVVISTIRVTNKSGKPVSGRLAVYPRPECGEVRLEGNGEYSLDSGKTVEFEVVWPDALKPEDLLKYPAIVSLAPGNPVISAVLFSEGKTKVFGVPAPFKTPNFIRERFVANDRKIQVRLDDGEKMEVTIPADKDNGRIPLIRKVVGGWAVAELAYCRYASATKGEAVVDGNDGEWDGSKWATVGEPCQARWVRGTDDKRASRDECNLLWASKAGERGVFISIKANGKVEKDNFTLFFDTRQPEFLGTPGPYYWVSGTHAKDGSFKVSKGETSKKAAANPEGKWKDTEYGAFIEVFIPYENIGIEAWPESGDLGFSLWWTHHGPNGITQLMWSEDGHPWNTRWYGVIRLEKQPEMKLPWMARVK